jgi:hypothetical protein
VATDKQNWTKAYNKKNPKATAAQRATAFASWQKSKGRGSGGSGGGNTPLGLPEGWGMTKTPDMVGSWANKPNLSSDEFEVAQGTDKKWYGRRLNEFTGLEPWMRDAVKKWDTDQTNRSNIMSGVQTEAINAARGLADSSAGRLTDLAKIASQSSQQSQALGGVAGGPQQMATSADAQAGAVAAGSAARAALTNAATSANQLAPSATTLATNAMTTLTNNARSESAATRQKLLSAFRSTVAAANAAKDTAIAKTYSDQARLLAAAIQSGARITEEQLSQMGQNFRNTQTNETSLANNAADNQTSVQNNTANNNAAANAASAKRRDTFVAAIPGMLAGKSSTTLDANGNIKSLTESVAPASWKTVVQQAVGQKIPLGPVLASLASQRPALRGNRAWAGWIASQMRSARMPNRTIQQTILRSLGVDVGTNGGLAGPGSPGRP